MAQKKFSVLALMVVCSMLLASCGGTTAVNTTVPATVAPTAMTQPTAMEQPTAMTQPTAMQPTAMATAMQATAMPATTPGGGAMMQDMTVTMKAQNGSGQDGTATLKGGVLTLDLKNGTTEPQPAHIHKGTCAALGDVVVPLTNVVGGKSDTTIPASFTMEAGQTYAINVHKSAAEVKVYTSCGDITSGGMTGTPGSTTTMDWSKVGPELADAYAGKLKGTKVTMFGPFGAEDEVKFNNSVKGFEAATGIDIVYEGSKEFETTINTRVKGGSAPDIADFPQPGLLSTIAKTGKVLDASKFINAAWLKQNYNQSFLDIATVDSGGAKILGGVFQRVNGKSLVWYPKKEFDAAGYKIPQTWDEMKTLMDKMVADGTTPWCIGIESGTATGWAATDWIEDIMLRTTSLSNYDKWVQGTLPFTSPEVKKATQMMADIWLNDKYVYGGTKQIVNTSFGDSVKPMFSSPPKCYLHRQGNFITSFFEQAKAGVKGGVDYDFFYLPPIDAQYGKPFLFAGDIMSAFNDRPEVRAVMQWFSTFEGVKGWVQAGGALAPQNDADPKAYTSAIDSRVADLIHNATSLRFDGSDQMPGAVGAGSFWKAMTNYVSGNEDIDKALAEAQAGWATVQK